MSGTSQQANAADFGLPSSSSLRDIAGLQHMCENSSCSFVLWTENKWNLSSRSRFSCFKQLSVCLQINVSDVVKEMRLQRHGMIQTKVSANDEGKNLGLLKKKCWTCLVFFVVVVFFLYFSFVPFVSGTVSFLLQSLVGRFTGNFTASRQPVATRQSQRPQSSLIVSASSSAAGICKAQAAYARQSAPQQSDTLMTSFHLMAAPLISSEICLCLFCYNKNVNFLCICCLRMSSWCFN